MEDLRVWRQRGASDGECERGPAPALAVADAEEDETECEGEERADVELAVVPGRDERRDGAAKLVGEAADARRRESESTRAEPEIREPPGEDDVEDERPGHREVRPEQESQEESGRVEDVAIERADERHAAEQVRIPEREVAAPHHGGPELPHRVAADVLVAVRGDEETTVEDRVSENACRERIGSERPDRGAAGGPTAATIVVGRARLRRDVRRHSWRLTCHCRGPPRAASRAASARWRESWKARIETHRGAQRYPARQWGVQRGAAEPGERELASSWDCLALAQEETPLRCRSISGGSAIRQA